jgi:hypothetical protein
MQVGVKLETKKLDDIKELDDIFEESHKRRINL